MTTLRFDDPNISAEFTLEIGDVRVTVPVFVPDEAEAVLKSTRAHARAYFAQTDRDPLATLGTALATWADRDDPVVQSALPILAQVTGFSPATIARFGLRPLGSIAPVASRVAAQHAALRRLVESGAYRSFSPWGSGSIKAFGAPRVRTFPQPDLVLQVLAGNVVGTMWLSLLFGMAGHCAQVLKLPSDDPVSFLYLLQTLETLDPALRSTIACGYYVGGSPVQEALLGEADVVFALGSDATMDALQAAVDRVNPQARLIRHGLKVGFQVVAREYANDDVAELVAWGASACDGNACFSPANVYVEQGGSLTPLRFAERVAAHMQAIARDVPPKRTIGAAERVTRYRHRQLQRRLLGQSVTLIKAAGTDVTVVVDEHDPALQPTCQERTLVVKPIADIRDVPQYVGGLRDNLQTVGLAVPTDRLLAFADEIGAAGATSLKPVGTEYIVGLDEPHDGLFDTLQLTFDDGLRWVHVSFTDMDKALAEALRANRQLGTMVAAS